MERGERQRSKREAKEKTAEQKSKRRKEKEKAINVSLFHPRLSVSYRFWFVSLLCPIRCLFASKCWSHSVFIFELDAGSRGKKKNCWQFAFRFFTSIKNWRTHVYACVLYEVCPSMYSLTVILPNVSVLPVLIKIHVCPYSVYLCS